MTLTSLKGAVRDRWQVELNAARDACVELTWPEASLAFRKLVGDDLIDQKHAATLALVQLPPSTGMQPTESVIDYSIRFRDIVSKLGANAMAQHVLVNLYMQGLTEEYRKHLIMLNGGKRMSTLDLAIRSATEYERILQMVMLPVSTTLAMTEAIPDTSEDPSPQNCLKRNRDAINDNLNFGNDEEQFPAKYQRNDSEANPSLNLQSGIHNPITGVRLYGWEVAKLRSKNRCFNCFQIGHLSKECTEQKKPYQDGWVDQQGQFKPYPANP